MWRRLTVDVGSEGQVLGGSVEFYARPSGGRDAVLVMPIGWGQTLSPVEALARLEVEGWLETPLPFEGAGGPRWRPETF
jgi:hypothetical protein